MQKIKNEELIEKSIELQKRFDIVENEIIRLKAYVAKLKPKCLDFKVESKEVLDESFIRFEDDIKTILGIFPLMRETFQLILILLDMKKNKTTDA